MRIVLFGTGPFAVDSFSALLDSNHEIVAMVTRPITDSGKRRKVAENPVRDLGEQHALPIIDPPDVNASGPVETLRSWKADLFVVCDYGQILSSEALSCARLGGINLHGSLLPKYRGAAPLHWAIANGETETGVTIIHMTPRLDGGPCLTSAATAIGAEETTEELEPRLAALGVDCVLESVAMLESWDGERPIGERQNQKQATKAPRLKRTDGIVDWNRCATDIVNQIRAFQPWPGTYTTWMTHGRKGPQEVRLILHRAVALPTPESISSDGQEPGTILAAGKSEEGVEQLLVKTGQGVLSILNIQPAGKKPMPIADFLRGKAPSVGETLQ